MSERLPARLRALASELTRLREQAGLTTRQVAARMGTSIATINRTENAKRTPSVADVATMLAIYGVTGAERTRILTMVEEVNSPGWMEVSPRFTHLLKALIDFESEAISIVNFGPSIVPGLLQTPGYARAITKTGLLDESQREALVSARMDRQKVLVKLVAPRYIAFLDEAALRRPYGGQEVMANQIRWLMDRAKLPNMEIRVIPFRHGGYRNPGHFAMFEFERTSRIVYVEHDGASGFLDELDDINLFAHTTSGLMKVALGSADSVNFLARILADYERS
ncbi:Helix-turn-helix domain-containing protein [Actinokineospora alba]|uniref:Helix-turn-helix domain-containing protein n=1 Tax=Actinokineospora alba TaxID=504798 RepID=A0A1H0TZS0_9PSEU|nr:helix-turn-helix transcriptional regulator [Actinokineospora alba]TDP70808.1 helix-turn-helix protein [Actinokineospora alba]SDJ17061.1 Helix-turn-helix domain-containing protein [Actinokineospora alba]SDP59255.1 Helix-turn-helix domain-containing protein [Actinokineospora alba]